MKPMLKNNYLIKHINKYVKGSLLHKIYFQSTVNYNPALYEDHTFIFQSIDGHF